ncbi:MAG: CoA-binding protein [Flavobacteriales bacterium]|nr:CoA-binding protein [Flavobacteriales bacterium]
MNGRITLVLGASPEPTRYAHIAVRRLLAAGHPVIAVGKRPGVIDGTVIQQELPPHVEVDTVTLYLNPQHQEDWMERLLALRPARIIFNPGAENPAFAAKARAMGIEVENACTLVMLATGQY